MPWLVTHLSRDHTARRDWLEQRRLVNNRWHVQHYANEAARVVRVLQDVVLFYSVLFLCKVAEFLHNSRVRVLSYLILFYCKWASCFTSTNTAVAQWLMWWSLTLDDLNSIPSEIHGSHSMFGRVSSQKSPQCSSPEYLLGICWNLKSFPAILEIFWKLIGPPWKL